MATSNAEAGPSSSPISPSPAGPSLPEFVPPPPIPFRKPGKSILKQPPPPQAKFFSLTTLSKLLPNQGPSQPGSFTIGNDDGKGIRGTPLKRAHFILPSLSTTYPINSANPPASPTLSLEKKEIEERERGRRARLVRGNSITSLRSTALADASEEFWSLEKVEQFYRECCFGRDELVDPKIVAAIKDAGNVPRSLVLSNVVLDVHSAVALADLLTIEWGLRKIVLKECNLDDLSLKPILHTLLIPNSLSYLSLAQNGKTLKSGNAWRLLGVYLSKAHTLQFLDLSGNNLDRRAVEYIGSALGKIEPHLPGVATGSRPATPTQGSTTQSLPSNANSSPKSSLTTLRLDSCFLRPAALETLAQAVRNSPLQHISLRSNRIAAPGGVALALMIKDYPDVVPQGTASVPTSPIATNMPIPPSPAPSKLSHVSSVRHSLPPLTSNPPAPANQGGGTTYTPYIPRSKRAAMISHTPSVPNSPTEERHVPLISTSLGGGITTRHPPPAHVSSSDSRPSSMLISSNARTPAQTPTQILAQQTQLYAQQGPSVALLDKVRALDSLPRLGALKTLDLRGNDIRSGVTYISQVLKRNRTLKILNLSDNKIAVEGLVSIAEALKYNSTLETLDMSRNPCCGPGLEGITSLRTAFTLNIALKRLFLSNTSLNSDGAIMLAEFLPESTSLLHLDLTVNNLDMAGVMALSNGLKANEVMRCLDLNIPPGDEEMARLCREILNWCVRNSERADARARSEGAPPRGRGIWGMIEESALARDVRKGEGMLIETDTLTSASEFKVELEALLQGRVSGIPASPTDEAAILNRSKAILPSLTAAIESSNDPHKLEEMLLLNDVLMELVSRVESLKPIRPTIVTNGHGLGITNGESLNGVETPPLDTDSITTGSSSLFSATSSTVNDSKAEEDEIPITPRADKGKGKAVQQEPTEFNLGSDDENHGKIIPEPGLSSSEEMILGGSPTDSRSRIWVEEEGEIFRKGVALLTQEKMEGELGEFAGEDLRIELLEAEVERAPARVIDLDIDGEPIPDNQPPMSPPVPRPIVSPVALRSPSPRTPT